MNHASTGNNVPGKTNKRLFAAFRGRLKFELSGALWGNAFLSTSHFCLLSRHMLGSSREEQECTAYPSSHDTTKAAVSVSRVFRFSKAPKLAYLSHFGARHGSMCVATVAPGQSVDLVQHGSQRPIHLRRDNITTEMIATPARPTQQ